MRGYKDQNVDFSESSKIYKDEFFKSGNKNLTVKIFPEAQHGLLKNEYFNEILPGTWFLIKLNILGDGAFIDGYFDFIIKWIVERINSI